MSQCESCDQLRRDLQEAQRKADDYDTLAFRLKEVKLALQEAQMEAKLCKHDFEMSQKRIGKISKDWLDAANRADRLETTLQESQQEVERLKQDYFKATSMDFIRSTSEYVQQQTALQELAEALRFYANPETYFGIGIFPDPPCGNFIDDFEDTDELGLKPGKRARAALAKAAQFTEKSK